MHILIEFGGTREAVRESLGPWLERQQWLKNAYEIYARMKYARAYTEGLEIGRAEAEAWIERRAAVLEKGEPFDEPPPWDSKAKTDY